MKENINTQEYWDGRFAKNDDNSWKNKGGEWQTRVFATEISKRLELPNDFKGTILDFGCALGDAIPVYRKEYPYAKFVGIDFSSEAIDVCTKKYGNIATFICGDVNKVPFSDVIISSNVLEHLSEDRAVAKELQKKCSDLYIAVPFEEELSDSHGNHSSEHINTYDKTSFDEFKATNKVYICRGLSFQEKLLSFFNIEVKNSLGPLFGKRKSYGGVYRQCLFHIKGLKDVN